MRLRILQVHHALYVPRLLARGFRALGHRADTLYFDFEPRSGDLTWGCDHNVRGKWWALPQQVLMLLRALPRYDIFHFWARPYMIPPLYTVFSKHFPWDLALLKRCGKTIVFQSDGCYTMVRPSTWKARIDPEVCHVCQTTQGDTYGFCSNENTRRLNEAMDRFADMRFGTALGLDWEEGAAYVFPPVDLERWNPRIEIPPEHVYRRRRAGSVLVFHGVGSHVIGNRGNIKGTEWIRETIEELQHEGRNVELMHVEGCPHDAVRFYQAQADIVVDQLLVGAGANARECLALGKPVLTRVHDMQWEVYREAAGGLEVPFIGVTRETLAAELVRLIDDADRRREIGLRSARFAQEVLAPERAAARYVEHYRRLLGRRAPSTSP